LDEYLNVLPRPRDLYAGAVDVLSDAVLAMRIGQPHSARVRHTAPFGRRFQPVAGAGFHLVLAGSCWLFPPTGAPIALAAGDVAFLPHGSGHGLADSPATALVDASVPLVPAASASPDEAPPAARPASTVLLCGAYLLDRSRAHPLLADLPDLIHLPSRIGRHSALHATVDLLGNELDRPRPGHDAMLAALLDALLLHILRAWFEDEPGRTATTSWAAALRDPAIHAALRALHGDPGRPWTVEELGVRAGLSRAAFARRFATLVGQPPLTYLTWWRMTLAARLLHDSDAPIAAIATRVGYASEFAFAHAFKRAHGLPPGRFRRNRPASALPR
jgi:AraC-like DNA-binding protein